MPLSTPDITPAQILSTLATIIGLFVTQGIVSNDTGQLIGGIASIVVPAAFALADAIIRHGRAQVAAAHAAKVIPPDQGDAGKP